MRIASLVWLTVAAMNAQILPSNWVGLGASFNQSTRPPVAGWISYAWLLSEKGQVYWISTQDMFLAPVKPHLLQSSVRTGIAMVVRSAGPLTLLGLGDAGIVAGGTTAGGAFSGGGIGIIRLGKTKWTIAVGARLIKTAGGNQTVYELGTGRIF